MGMLEELNDLLDRIPIWKRLIGLPDKVRSLEDRVAKLEAQLGGKHGATCPICNAPGLARTASAPDPVFGDFGVMRDSYACVACGHAEHRQRDPSKG